MASSEIREFRLEFGGEELVDLHRRLDQTRWPDAGPTTDWSLGAPLDHLRGLVDHWRHRYDWRAWQSRINALPQFVTEIDGARVHFAHLRSPEPEATPLILTHGWPSSVVEYLDVVGPLTDPRSHGGDPADAFHLVIPTPPGYTLSGPAPDLGWGAQRIARAWAELMRRLGYGHYGAQGGDWGTWISRELGILDAEHVLGVHTNGLISWPSGDPAELDGLTEAEQERLGRTEYYMKELYGFKLIQSTRPQTFAYPMADSPVGLLAWIANVFHEWTDGPTPEQAVGRDALLTTVMLYWLTNTAGSAARSFVETPDTPEHAEQEGWHIATPTVPMGVAVFPHDIVAPVRRFAERDNPTIVHWSEFAHGGTFAALERPKDFVGDVQAFFAGLRQG
jgi:epoxide hydrolase